MSGCNRLNRNPPAETCRFHRRIFVFYFKGQERSTDGKTGQRGEAVRQRGKRRVECFRRRQERLTQYLLGNAERRWLRWFLRLARAAPQEGDVRFLPCRFEAEALVYFDLEEAGGLKRI